MTAWDDLPELSDVVIAGGGPSGLFLAVDLAQRGISSVVLEPRVELDWLHPRAKTTNARTMTHLRRLGLADRLRERAPLPVSFSEDVLFCTSLAGHELIRFENAFGLQTGRYEPQPECGQQVAQPVVEQVLREAADEDPRIALCLGARFTDADPGPDGHRVRVTGPDGAEREIRCRYLIGADGVSSAVRRCVGQRLEGGSAAKSNLGLLFRAPELAERVTLDPAVQYWVIGGEYAGMVGPMDTDGLWWAILHGYDAEHPRFADVPAEQILRTLTGIDVEIDVLAQDPWTARMLLAPHYRIGDTFLVGDAAHANPPWGGHGFNTCIGDAANLAWKLAATLQGWGGEDLLDSYHAERRPVARRTIDDAASNGRLLADDLVAIELDRHDAEGDRARARAATALAEKRSEFDSLGLVLGYSYPQSSLVSPSGAAPPADDPVHYRPSAAPGCLLPHRWLDAGDSVYDLLGPGFTLLVDSSDDGPDVRRVRATVQDLGDRHRIPLTVRTIPAQERALAQAWEATMLLIRPDQHVAWRGADPVGLEAALLRAVGTSSTVTCLDDEVA